MNRDTRSLSSLTGVGHQESRLSVWMNYPKRNPQARLRLFCFPYAGGGASIFRTWPQALPSTVEVCAVQPPGREGRFQEAPVGRLSGLVQALLSELPKHLDQPFAFFGHSLGALVAFEVACALRARQLPTPVALLVSGRGAPQLPRREAPIHQLPDAPFIAALRRLGGTPEPVLQHQELMQVLLPVLRSDFSIAETYVYSERAPLDCPISAFGGSEDTGVSPADLMGWQRQTSQPLSTRLFAGGHFFIHTDRDALLEAVSADLAQLVRDGDC